VKSVHGSYDACRQVLPPPPQLPPSVPRNRGCGSSASSCESTVRHREIKGKAQLLLDRRIAGIILITRVYFFLHQSPGPPVFSLNGPTPREIEAPRSYESPVAASNRPHHHLDVSGPCKRVIAIDNIWRVT
jgi:hypothetical protein